MAMNYPPRNDSYSVRADCQLSKRSIKRKIFSQEKASSESKAFTRTIIGVITVITSIDFPAISIVLNRGYLEVTKTINKNSGTTEQDHFSDSFITSNDFPFPFKVLNLVNQIITKST